MQTFKQFLTEASRTRAVDASDLIRWADAHCAGYLAGDVQLFRGFNSSPGTTVIGSSAGATPRKSVGGVPNNYTLWIDGNPEFADFPKRSSAFIAATSEYIASKFGTPYLMLVKDSDRVANTLSEDIWQVKITPGWGGITLDDMNRTTEMVLEEAGDAKCETYAQLSEALRHMTLERLRELAPKVHGNNGYQARQLADMMGEKGWKNMWELWNGVLNPGIFQLTTADGLEKSNSPHEMWVQGECGFVSLDKKALPDADRGLILEWLDGKNKKLANRLKKRWED